MILYWIIQMLKIIDLIDGGITEVTAAGGVSAASHLYLEKLPKEQG